MYRLSIILLLALAALSSADRFHFGATLSGAQEVPPVQSEGEGSAAFHYDDDDNILHLEIAFEGVTPSGVHIHGPARPGDTAGHVIEFEVDDDTDLIKGAYELNDEVAEWLKKGLLYVNVHSEENPDGEIRGQIVTTSHDFYAHLTGAKQRPNAVNTAATGKGEFKFDPDNREIEHGVNNPTMAHIHAPAGDIATANPIITLDAGSPIEGEQVLTELQVQYLKAGLMYVNIHSAQHPNGEIRGQIMAEATSSGEQAEGVGTMLFVGLILGAVAVSTLAALGGVAFYMNYKRNKFTMIAPE